MLRILDPADGFIWPMPGRSVVPFIVKDRVITDQLADFPALVSELGRQGLEWAKCTSEAGGVRIGHFHKAGKPRRGAARVPSFLCGAGRRVSPFAGRRVHRYRRRPREAHGRRPLALAVGLRGTALH